jgi:hypothetical protein
MIAVALALAPAAALAQSWQATFPVAHTGIPPESAGVYTGGAIPLLLDSLGGAMMMPNTTGRWTVVPNSTEPAKGKMIFYDPVVGLKMHPPNGLPERLEGTLSAMATVNRVFGPTKATVTVNVTGGAGGKGAVSRQGPMIRWNGSTQFITCYVDFSAGTAYLWAARSAIHFQPIGPSVPIPSFSKTKAYRIEFTMVGDVARCKVFDRAVLVADTGNVQDAQTPQSGATGVLIEITASKPEQALEGSFSELSVTTP